MTDAIGLFNKIVFDKNTIDPDACMQEYVKACRQYDINLKYYWLGFKDSYRYRERYRRLKNVMTWGVRWKHEMYTRLDQNILFFEMGYLRQAAGVYIDSRGLYGDSSIVADNEWKHGCEWEEILALYDYVKETFGWELFAGGKEDGPILIVMQNEVDAPVRNYYNHRDKDQFLLTSILRICRDYLPKDRPVVVRPHPRFYEKWQRREENYKPYFLDHWIVDDCKKKIYEVLPECSAVVTINSTVATEALTLGLPVVTLGNGVFTGSQATLECGSDAKVLKNISHWRPSEDKMRNLLCCLLRHQVPWDLKAEDLLENQEFQKWVQRIV